MGSTAGTGSLPAARLPIEPRPMSEIFVVVRDILGVRVVR